MFRAIVGGALAGFGAAALVTGNYVGHITGGILLVLGILLLCVSSVEVRSGRGSGD